MAKFVRVAVDWLLRADIGEVIKKIVDDEEHSPIIGFRKSALVERSPDDEPSGTYLKPDGVGLCRGDRTRMATASVSLCERMKS